MNEILPGVLYQRGQILTWQREKKYTVLQEYGIKTVVNFWPKVDPDLAESPVDNYLQLSAPRSEQMLETRMEQAAEFVAQLCRSSPALVLCEAGVTRSVYFCVLLVSLVQGVTLLDALGKVSKSLRRGVRLKSFMMAHINGKTQRV